MREYGRLPKWRWLCLLCFSVLSGSGRHFPRVLCMPFVMPILSWKLPTRRASKAMLVVLLRTCPEGMFGPWVRHNLVPGSCSRSSPVSVLYSCRSVIAAMPNSTWCLSTVSHSHMICMHASCMAHPFSNERLENADWWFLKLGAVPVRRSTRVLDHLLVPVWHCPVSATVKALLSRLKQCAEQSGQSGGLEHEFYFPQELGWWSNLTFIFFRGAETTNHNDVYTFIHLNGVSIRITKQPY